MRRRQCLTVVGAATAALAGCSSLDAVRNESQSSSHPLAGETQIVGITDESTTEQDLVTNTTRALDFWEENSNQYAGFEVSFELDENRDDPDISIVYADTPRGCDEIEGTSKRVMGCAPYIKEQSRIERPVTARVVAGTRHPERILVTTKHELGHMLGLGHTDQPQQIMSNDPADRIPLYQTRVDIWQTINDAQRAGKTANDAFNRGHEAWKEDSFETAQKSFQDANSAYVEMNKLLTRAEKRTSEFERHEALATLDLAQLQSQLDQLQRRTSLAETFTQQMVDATRAAIADETERANELLEQSNDGIARFNEIEVPEMEAIAASLGLAEALIRNDPGVTASPTTPTATASDQTESI